MLDTASDKLKQNLVIVINRWEQRVLNEVEAARLQKKLALRNSLRVFLEQLAEELSDAHRSENQIESGKLISTKAGREHGQSRARSIQYTIDQLIYEYHVLRQVICEVLEQDGVLDPKSKDVIVAYIEQAVNDAATEFSNTIKDIQGQLSRTLAHDLRNPISVAKVSAELILRRPEDKNNCIDKAARISTCMDRIDKMIRDLLDTTRIKAGEGLVLDFNKCDLDWITREIAYESNLASPGKVLVDSDQQTIGFWNEDGLRRILENLVTNGIKYGDTRTPVIVTLKKTENFVSLSIHNEGRPILEQDQKKIFEPFQRSSYSEGQQVGWGIGLSVVKTLVDAHQGEITVDSEEGKGTTFHVTLPIDSRSTSVQSLHQ